MITHFISLQGLVVLGQVLLHPARGFQTFSQRPHSPLCCSSSSPSSRAWQSCSNPCIVWAKPHIKFALHKPFHWAAAGIPLLGHLSVYMVWTHIWNKASQSRIILRKLHTFQVLQHMSFLFHALLALERLVQIHATGTLQSCSCERSKISPCICNVLNFIMNSGFSPHQECQLNRKRKTLRELSMHS